MLLTALAVLLLGGTRPAFALIVSGTVYSDAGSTAAGAGITVRLIRNGADLGSDSTNGSGLYSMDVPLGAGDAFLVYLDGEVIQGTTVTVSDGADLAGLDIHDGRVIARHDNGGSLSVVDMTAAIGNNNDPDILYNASASAVTIEGADTELYVPAGHTFSPGGNVNAIHVKIDGSVDGGNDTFTVSGNWDAGTGTFSAGTSDVTFTGGSALFTPGGLPYYDLTLIKGAGADLDVAGSVVVTNSLLLNSSGGGVNGGPLAARGDVSVGNGFGGGTATILFDGTGDQNLSSSGGILPHVRIDKPSGTLSLTSSLNLGGDWTYVAGTVDLGTAALTFVGTGATFTPGPLSYRSIVVDKDTAEHLTVNGTATVTQSLQLTSGTSGNSSLVLGGAFNVVGGSVSVGAYFGGGTTSINILGTANQTISSFGGYLPSVTINKPSGVVNLGNPLNITGDWTHVSGTLDSGGFALRFIGDSATFTPGTPSYSTVEVAKGAGQTLTLGSDLSLSGDLTITSGTLDVSAASYGIDLEGDFSNSGAFVARSGTFTLSGSAQTITGSTGFYNLTKTVTGNDTLTFEAGSTQTVYGTATFSGTATQLLALRSSVPGTRWNLTLAAGAAKSISYVDVQDSDASGSDPSLVPVSPANSVNSYNNLLWFGDNLLSGTVYTDEGATAAGAGLTVRVVVNGVTQGTAETGADGSYLAEAAVNPGDALLAYLDGETIDGTTVTVSDGGDLAGLDIYADHLITRHDSGGSLTITDMAAAEGGYGDAEILYTVSGGNLSVAAGVKLYVLSGHTFAPGGDVDSTDVEVLGTLDGGSNTFSVSRHWDAGSGTFSGSDTTIVFSGNVNSLFTPGPWTYGNITVDKNTSTRNVTLSGGSLTMAPSKVLVISTGIFDLAGNDLDTGAGSTFSNTGVLRLQGSETLTNLVNDTDSGTVVYNGGASYTGLAVGDAYYNLEFDNSAGTWTLDNALDMNRDLTITSGTLDVSPSNYPITVYRHWTNYGTFVPRSGTVTLDGNAHTILGSTTFHNLVKTATEANTLTFGAGSTQTITGTVTLGGAAGELLGLVSTVPGSMWYFTVSAGAVKDISFVTVRDSDASGSDATQKPIDPTDSVNGGNTIDWFTDTCPTVTTTADSGPGSLRQCIAYANSNVGTTISFDVPDTDPGYTTSGGNSWWRISPTSALPTITANGTVIDGTTQAANYGSDTNSLGPEIEIDGSGAGAGANGLTVNVPGGNATIRHLVVDNFTLSGILLEGGSTTVTASYIGLRPDGDTLAGNNTSTTSFHGGVRIVSAGNTIGGTGAADRNVISGNALAGIVLNGAGATGNQVLGNYIGLDATGTLDRGNVVDGEGIEFQLADGNTIGGTVAGARNVISGNASDGLEIDGSSSNIVQGNYIGTDYTGTVVIPNDRDGIDINSDLATGSTGNLIGGTAAGAGNLIRGNGIAGVELRDDTVVGATTDNSILGNIIYGNGGLGIDLQPAGVTLNDAGDGDTGVNGLQNFPVITSVVSGGVSTTITGTLNSYASATFRLEFYSTSSPDPLGYGEGDSFLGTTSVTTDGAGDASFTVNFPSALQPGDYVNATATGPDGSTSEFSLNRVLPLDLVKQAVLAVDGSLITDSSTLPRGTEFKFLIYTENNGPARSDVSIQDVLDPAFAYSNGSLKVDNSASVGTSVQAIYSAVNGTAALSDIIDADVASITGSTINVGNQNAANGQLDIAANRVWALLFTVRMQ